MAFAVAGLFCAALSWAGANPLAPAPLALLAAVHWAVGRPRLAGVTVLGAAAIGGMVTLRIPAGVFYALFVLAGLVLGQGIRHAWPFGRVVAVFTAVTFGAFTGFVMFHMTWSGWQRQAAASYEAFEVQMRGAAEDPAEHEAVLEFLRWILVERWADVSIGLTFASFLTGAVLAVGVTAFWVRIRHGMPGPRTTFASMRPPEWLVWPVIACAGLWFVEQRASHDVLRAVAWNGAIGLAAIYWLNGVGIVVYAVRHLQPHVFVVAALVLFLMYAGGWLLSIVGLFDTWWELRVKVDRVVAVREKLRDRSGDGDGE